MLLAGCESTSSNQTASNDMDENTRQGLTGQNNNSAVEPNALTGNMDISAQDKQFILSAASSGMYEAQAGQLAVQKTTADKIRQLAQNLVDDHTKVNDQLKALAQGKGVTIPTGLNPDHQGMLDQLNKLDGTAFDSEYLRQQAAGHRAAVDLFQNETIWGTNSDIKQFASNTLPTLQKHRDMVREFWSVESRSEKNREIPGALK